MKRQRLKRNFWLRALQVVSLVSLIWASDPPEYRHYAISRAPADDGDSTPPPPPLSIKTEVRQTPTGREVWYRLHDGEEMKLMGPLIRWPAGSLSYHWDKEEITDRWDQQGSIHPGELEFWIDQPEGQMAGGGVYSSQSAIDSISFGPGLTVLRAPQDLTLIDSHQNGSGSSISFDQADAYPILWRELRDQGIDGVKYSRTWMNFFHSRALTSVRRGDMNDVWSWMLAAPADGKAVSFGDIINLYQRIPAEPHPAVQKHFPLVNRVLAEQPLNQTEQQQLYEFLRDELFFEIFGDQPSRFRTLLVQSVWPQYIGYLRDRFASFDETEGPGFRVKFGHRWDFERTVMSMMRQGIRPNEIHPDIRPRRSTFHVSTLPETNFAPVVTNDYGKRLAASFEYLDLYDLLGAIAEGNPQPWRIYDEPGLPPLADRWQKALTKFEYLEIHHELSGNPNSTYRGKPVVAGGDIFVGGQGYYRVSARQRAVLEANPYLKTEFVADPSASDGSTFLARHEYPSARTYERFRDRLKPELVQELDQARSQGQLDDVNSSVFESFTRRIIENLMEGTQNSMSTLHSYQEAMAIHPFDDYNGRTLRARYRNYEGHPLFLRSFDLDLFLTYEELAVEAALGRLQYERIRESFVREEMQNPSYPKFNDLPEMWQVAVNQDTLNEPPQQFVQRMKAQFASTPARRFLRANMYRELYLTLRGDCTQSQLNALLGLLN